MYIHIWNWLPCAWIDHFLSVVASVDYWEQVCVCMLGEIRGPGLRSLNSCLCSRDD